MQRKHISLASLTSLGICAALALAALPVKAQDKKVDPTGTWTFSAPTRARNGGGGGGGGNAAATPRVLTLKLKADGDKVTGTLTTPPGRGGGDPTDTPIADGKLKGDMISFNIVREGRNGGPASTNKYEGKIDGDTIKGTQTGGAGGRGRRNGGGGGAGADTSGGGMAGGAAPAPTPWEAKKSK